MLPCRSTASVRPSGDTATDIDVPSWTVTSMRGGVAPGAPLSATASTNTPSAVHLRRMQPPGNDGETTELAHSLRAASSASGGFFCRGVSRNKILILLREPPRHEDYEE